MKIRPVPVHCHANVEEALSRGVSASAPAPPISHHQATLRSPRFLVGSRLVGYSSGGDPFFAENAIFYDSVSERRLVCSYWLTVR